MNFKEWLENSEDPNSSTTAIGLPKMSLVEPNTDAPIADLVQLILKVDPHHTIRRGDLALVDLTHNTALVGTPDFISPERAGEFVSPEQKNDPDPAVFQNNILDTDRMWGKPFQVGQKTTSLKPDIGHYLDKYEQCLKILQNLKAIDTNDSRHLAKAWNEFKTSVRNFSESNIPVSDPRAYLNYRLVSLEIADCEKIFSKIANLINERKLVFFEKLWKEFYSLHDSVMSKIRKKIDRNTRKSYRHSNLALFNRTK